MPLPSLKRRTTKHRKPKPSQFTDEQIRERAYMLSLKHSEQSPEANWHAAIEALKREQSLLWQLRQSWQTATPKENRDFTLDVVKMLISAFGVLATIFAGVGLYLTYRTGQAQLESAQQERQLNNERLVTDRFAKAVEQLGSQDMNVRLGGIYSLERIAKDSPKDHWTVMEVLTAYIRNESPVPKTWIKRVAERDKPLPDVATDVQSVLTVVGRREVKSDPQDEHVNLRGCNLNSANLRGAHLSNANLGYANLYGVRLQGANLSGAYLYHAIFSDANLNSVNLSGAGLVNADLRVVSLDQADLSSAFLSGANLLGVDLRQVNLTKTNLQYSLYNDSTQFPKGFDPTKQKMYFVGPNADLRNADLGSVYLNAVDLNHANLENANIYDAQLNGTRNITPNQIKRAKNWQQAHYSPDFRKQLGLPPEKLNP